MKVLHIDWESFLGFMEPWNGLSASARAWLLESKPKAVVPRRSVGDEFARLVAGKFLTAVSDERRVRLSDGFHETHKALRSFARHPILLHPDPRTLREYLVDHFTGEERRALDASNDYEWDHDARLISTVTSVSHVRGFLQAEDRRAWEKERLPGHGWSGDRAWTQSRSLLKAKNTEGDLLCLIATLSASSEPIPFRALSERCGSLPRARLGNAIEAGLRYLLCFPALDAGLEPVLMLWPGVSARLRRVPTPAPTRLEPEESLCVAFRMEDLIQLLVRAAEPLRLKANGWSLFVAVERELEHGLLPLPAWLTSSRLFPENAPGARVKEALHLARELGFVAESETRERGLTTTPAGWRWLDASPAERLRTLLDRLRPEPERPPGRKVRARPDEDVELDLFGARDEILDEIELLEEALGDAFDADLEDGLVPFDSRRSLGAEALSDAALFGYAADKGSARAAIAAYAALEPGCPVSFHAFLTHHAEASNPLLEHGRSGRRRFGMAGPATEEALEELWCQGLMRILHLFLLPHGGVRVGLASVGGLTIELTSAGRYLLGLVPDFTLDGPTPSKTPVRVQPDFEVVFVAGSPGLEAAISRFADRRGTGVGVLFRITRESIFLAAQAGLGAEDVLTTLASASTVPVPVNVEHEIRAWFAACRRLALEPVHLVRCPDATTAARVLASAGAGKLEMLSETVLALTDPAHKTALVRACRKAGLFLASTGEQPAKTGRKRRWRRV